MAAYRHIVVFQFYDAIDEESRMHAVERLRSLNDSPGVVEWRVEVSIDDRKGPVVVQNVLFDTQESYEKYRATPEHADIAAILSGLSNWLVADYIE